MIGFALNSARAAYAVQGQLAHQRDGLPSQLGTSTVNFCLFQSDWAATIIRVADFGVTCGTVTASVPPSRSRVSRTCTSLRIYTTCTASLFLTPARPGAQRTGRDRRLHRGHL